MNANTETIEQRAARMATALSNDAQRLFLEAIDRNVLCYITSEDMGDEDKVDVRFCVSQRRGGWHEVWFTTKSAAHTFCVRNSLKSQFAC